MALILWTCLIFGSGWLILRLSKKASALGRPQPVASFIAISITSGAVFSVLMIPIWHRVTSALLGGVMTASIPLILTFATWADHWGRDAGKAADAEEDAVHVDRNWPLLIFVASGVIGAPVFALLFLKEVSGDLAPLGALEVCVIVIFELFALFVTVALIWLIHITMRTRFTTEGVSQPRSFGLKRPSVIRWEDVRRIEWRGASLEFRLISANTKIGLCIYFFHMQQLLRLFDAYLPVDVDALIVSRPRRRL